MILYWFFSLFFNFSTNIYMSLFPSVRRSFHLSVCLSVCHAPYLRNCTSSSHIFCYTCVKWYLQDFFSFFKTLIFWVVRGVKGQKVAQNDKKFLSPLISQESYNKWLSIVVHKCKMIISPGIFLFFQSFDFLGC